MANISYILRISYPKTGQEDLSFDSFQAAHDVGEKEIISGRAVRFMLGTKTKTIDTPNLIQYNYSWTGYYYSGAVLSREERMQIGDKIPNGLKNHTHFVQPFGYNEKIPLNQNDVVYGAMFQKIWPFAKVSSK